MPGTTGGGLRNDTGPTEGAEPGLLRLRAAARLVPLHSRVADIGTDHGILARILVTRREADFCVATELIPARLSRSRGLPPGHPLAERLDFRHGDGLSVLDPGDRIEVLTLTGLGARTILKILEGDQLPRLGVRRVVLQPQSQWAELRRGLVPYGLGIVAETLVKERGRYYVVIAAEPGAAPLLPASGLAADELHEAGPGLIAAGGPVVRQYWLGQRDHHERVLLRARGKGRAEALRRRNLAARVLSLLPG